MIEYADMEQTRLAFDAAAPLYDTSYEGLPGIRRIRSITSALYLRYFPRGGRLLEINCGTGNDAIFLARHGMSILATDLSPAMLEEARRKIALSNFEHSVEIRHVPFDRLGELRGMDFDGAYSNLGGLNCTDRLESVAKDLARLVKPGGFLIATVMPSVCLWETAAFLGRFRWQDAFRRMGENGALANLHGGKVRTFYYSPRLFRSLFAPHFEHVKTLGLAVFTPPPNFVRAYRKLGKSIRLLERLDDTFAGIPPFSSVGDHYAIVLRRRK